MKPMYSVIIRIVQVVGIVAAISIAPNPSSTISLRKIPIQVKESIRSNCQLSRRKKIRIIFKI